ncbi:hypothetical protein [Vibrio navarrensis]|uniref:hypothetical protein n=1 Tax=Vibrio navarrensis TaxID=29495 RepID=UPI0018DDF455|nr:hypothetical protein [Vibrio navarrensis]MBH9742176.1 hypothetical protein [Vibrio navarrensis]
MKEISKEVIVDGEQYVGLYTNKLNHQEILIAKDEMLVGLIRIYDNEIKAFTDYGETEHAKNLVKAMTEIKWTETLDDELDLYHPIDDMDPVTLDYTR